MNVAIITAPIGCIDVPKAAVATETITEAGLVPVAVKTLARRCTHLATATIHGGTYE